jgi:uncharacterized protein YecT (DUF1311 family)
MNFVKTISFFLIIFLYAKNCNSQTIKTIDSMSIAFQKRLDTGVEMLKCTKEFYFQMDSMLNIVYNKLRTKLNTTEKDILKKEQLTWLKKRDAYFKKENKKFLQKFNSNEWGSDMYMIIYEEEAEFVKGRTIVLLNRIIEKTP